MRYIILLLALLYGINSTAQELNISVTVNAPQLKIADPKVFKALERDIDEFFNNQQFTSDEFRKEERIEGSFILTITNERSDQEFVADLQIQSIRPVFNSDYKTKLINYKEAIPFTYVQNQPIQISKDRYFDNLSSVLTFYVYAILAFDYDSFAPKGGEDYWRITQNIVNSIPDNAKSADDSWKDNSSKRGRYWLVENIFSPRLRLVREAIYTYHRRGLDFMYENPNQGKAVIQAAIRDIESANENYPNSMLVNMFGDSKNEEVVDIFLNSDPSTKLRMYQTMVAIDPYRANIYGKLK